MLGEWLLEDFTLMHHSEGMLMTHRFDADVRDAIDMSKKRIDVENARSLEAVEAIKQLTGFYQ